MDRILISENQAKLLDLLVEASRVQTPKGRQPFCGLKDSTSAEQYLLVPHPGLPENYRGIYPGDVEQLSREGLLTLDKSPRGTWTFEVAPLGEKYYEWLKVRQGTAPARVEQTLRTYLDVSGLAQRHSTALAKWAEAEAMLWGPEPTSQVTTIGHLCREAHQEFATSVIGRLPSADASGEKTKTKIRIRAALESLPTLSETVKTFALALAGYWDAVVDLAQRQEHANLKEDCGLAWEDSRRLVFHTIVAMTDLDRIVESSSAASPV